MTNPYRVEATAAAFLLLLAAPFIFSSQSASAAETKKPNILFILTDNLGYGELGVYGGGELRGVPTPRLDKLAAEGLRLTNFNVEPQCTPSRSALMTGRHPIRSGTTKVVWGMLYGMTQWEKDIAHSACYGNRGPVASTIELKQLSPHHRYTSVL